MKKEKILAVLAAMMMLASCGQAKVELPDVPQNSDTVAVTTAAESTDTTAPDTFDDKDAFGDGGVSTSVSHNVVTIAPSADDGDTGDSPSVVTAAPAGRSTQTTTEYVQTTTESYTTTEATEPMQTLIAPDSSSEKDGKSKSKKKASSDGVKISVSKAGGWNDGKSDFIQVDVKITNTGKENINSWTATIPFGGSAAIDQNWSSNVSISKGVITATPVDYNQDIAPGGEASFGIIVKDPGSPDLGAASVTAVFGASTVSWNNNNNNNNNGGNAQAVTTPAKDVPPPTTDDWLYCNGTDIVDAQGRKVWLTGINWFGYNTGTNTFDGLWACDLNSSLAAIADHGFNCLRVPFSAELINQWAAGQYPTANYNHAYNSYLEDKNSLEIWDYVVGQCRANGLKIIIDIHSAKTDASGHMKPMWYEGDVTEKDYLKALSWMANRYKKDDTIIAYDLKNEPHGKANEKPRAKWDNSYDPDNWRYEAEKAANAVLSKNPNVLVLVEGIEIYPIDPKKGYSSTDPKDYYSTWWGANLRGVKDYPVDLGKYRNKLVYSPHDYGPSVYQQEWFKGDYTYNSLKKDAWNDNWLYIYDSGTAPILIGEWGGFMTEPNLTWMKYLGKLIKEKQLHHTFWCFNANSGDTGGMVKDDFITWDEEKYKFVKQVLWQQNGKFVGLDHQIPLGENGKVLS
ncbi:MAG: cellulase family glycosylhydrolase [Oscillospiraceae bacterium]|nr:cellulase family glycosylhydrolase [Oscillospiraceae bacterium]